MKKNLILKLIVGVIFLLAVVGMYMVASANSALAVASPDDIIDAESKLSSATSFVVMLAIVLLVIAAAFAIISSLVTLVKQPAALTKALIGIGIFAVFIVIAYVLASDTQVFGANGEELIEKNVAKVSKWSGAGLYLTVILLVIGGVGFVGDLLRSLIKS